MISITDAVEGWATDPPDTPAIRYGERQIGYPELMRYVAGEIDEVASLRDQLLAQLPAHSVPSQWQLLAALPRLLNGKVDRHRLSQQATEMLTRVAQPPALIQPATDDPEAILTQLWREVLGLSEIGPEDDFIAAGGHSLLAARLARRIRETFNVEMRPIEVLTHPTIRTELEWLATVARRPLGGRAVSSELKGSSCAHMFRVSRNSEAKPC